MITISRFRLALVTAMMCVVALDASGIFDRRIWWLLVPPLVVSAAALAATERRWVGRLGTAIAATALGTVLVVIPTGGSVPDLVASFGAGGQRLLSTEWPSPVRPDLLGTIATMLGLATACAAELTRRTRFHLAPLLPIVIAQIIVIGLRAPQGAGLWSLLPLGILAMFYAAIRPGRESRLTDRLVLLRGERRLVPTACVAIGMAAIIAGPLTLTARADPRRIDPADSSAAVIDPVEATLALQAIDPAIELHQIEVTSDTTGERPRLPLRWRTAALDEYDGRRWSPDLVLRPIGRRLGLSTDDEIDYTVTFENDDLQFVPVPGAPVVIDAPIETDANRTLVGLIGRPALGRAYRVISRVEPEANEANGAIGISEVDENTTALFELATELAAEGGGEDSIDVLGQLQGIEDTMRNDFTLRSDAEGGGLQRALMERFLRDTQTGNAEQFSAAFVLLARSLGVDARVATGYEIDPDRVETGDTSVTILSSDAAIWPEVRIGDEWVAFDPVPEVEDSDQTPPPPEPQVQTPAAPQPPIAPPPEIPDEPVVVNDIDEAGASAGLPTFIVYALYTLGAIAGLLVPVALFAALVLGTKWRRRRRFLSGPPSDRIRGAWSVATSAFVDAGMSIAASDTNREIATDAVDYAPDSRREVDRLSTLATATTFGQVRDAELWAQDASVCLGHVETSMTEARTFWQRLTWRLSLRSLRRRTASPV